MHRSHASCHQPSLPLFDFARPRLRSGKFESAFSDIDAVLKEKLVSPGASHGGAHGGTHGGAHGPPDAHSPFSAPQLARAPSGHTTSASLSRAPSAGIGRGHVSTGGVVSLVPDAGSGQQRQGSMSMSLPGGLQAGQQLQGQGGAAAAWSGSNQPDML